MLFGSMFKLLFSQWNCYLIGHAQDFTYCVVQTIIYKSAFINPLKQL